MSQTHLTLLRLRLVSLKIQLDDALTVLDALDQDAVPSEPLGCLHPSEKRTDVSTMGEPFRKFFCAQCNLTVTTTEPVGP